ncbi:MAG: PD-(D/E)XK nuclease family protein [Enterobacterales bacterium]|nr:PD-(D/E)XK nuclease family protein [Enterobacterales bacterium]
MTLRLNFTPIAAKIDAETLILTPNARTRQALEAGRMVEMSTGDVVKGLNLFSVSQWQQNLWQQLAFQQILPIVIDNLAVKAWLTQLIEAEDEWVLTNPKGVADQVLSAYQNLCHWQLPLDQISAESSVEVSYFIEWISAFESFCQQKQLIAEFKKLAVILLHWELVAEQLPAKILMVGFNHLTPLEEALFNKVKLAGTQIEYYSIEKNSQQPIQILLNDIKSELDFAARYTYQWSMQQQQKGTASDDHSIAVVVDQLTQNLPLVHETFSQVFHAEEEKPWLPLCKPSYNVSAGLPLLEQPIVNAAIKLLKINPHRISFEELQFLKNTPFIGWDGSKQAVGHFIHQQLLKGKPEYDLAFIKYQIKLQKDAQPLDVLLKLLTELSQLKTKSSMTEHMLRFKEFLIYAGFSEGHNPLHPLDYFENEALKGLVECMTRCEIMDYLTSQLSFNQALDYLQQACLEQAFQVASDRSKIQVLGVLEASGLEFEQLLLVGFNQDSWPQKNKINPFLPLALQREYNMPGSSAEREYHYAKKLSNSLMHSSQELIATASYDETKTQSNLSGLFSHFKAVDACELIDDSNESKTIDRKDRRGERFEWVDNQHLSLKSELISGGAYLLSDYAKCPFQAMLKYQFRSKDYQPQAKGIDPRDKGSWLHAAMEAIWLKLNNQAQLKAMSEYEIELLVREVVMQILEKDFKTVEQRLGQTLVQMEAEKLIQRIIDWLRIELTREEFTVNALEKKNSCSI